MVERLFCVQVAFLKLHYIINLIYNKIGLYSDIVSARACKNVAERFICSVLQFLLFSVTNIICLYPFVKVSLGETLKYTFPSIYTWVCVC